MSTAETGSRAHRGTQKAEPRLFAGTLLCRLPCGGELFVRREYRAEEDTGSGEFEKGDEAFGGFLRLFCPNGVAHFNECPRLVGLRNLLVSLDPDDAAAQASAPDHGQAEGDGFAHLAAGAADGFGNHAPLVNIASFLDLGAHVKPSFLRGLSEMLRKRREAGQCIEDFVYRDDHAAESTTDGDGRKAPAADA